jgi:hypothetical protein
VFDDEPVRLVKHVVVHVADGAAAQAKRVGDERRNHLDREVEDVRAVHPDVMRARVAAEPVPEAAAMYDEILESRAISVQREVPRRTRTVVALDRRCRSCIAEQQRDRAVALACIVCRRFAVQQQDALQIAALQHHRREPQPVRIAGAAQTEIECGASIGQTETLVENAAGRWHEVVGRLRDHHQAVHRFAWPSERVQQHLRRVEAKIAAARRRVSDPSLRDACHGDDLPHFLLRKGGGVAHVVEDRVGNGGGDAAD